MTLKNMLLSRKSIDSIRAWNRNRISRRRLAKEVVMTPHGFWFNGNASMQDGTFEVEETALVKRILDTTDMFVNVGANAGYYCCIALQQGVETVAIEPIPNNIGYIAQNIKANGWEENITTLPVAVGDRSGFIDIFGIGTGASVIKGWSNNPESLKLTVPMVRLDKVIGAVSGKRMFILMDVEGFELEALLGAEGLHNPKEKPIWFVEVLGHGGVGQPPERQDNFAKTFKLMFDAGYAVYEANQNLRPLTWDDILEAQQNPDIQDNVRNYLFVDADLNVDEVVLDTGNKQAS
ncbi:FkbM family methyltransferase [Profundibacter sp.]